MKCDFIAILDFGSQYNQLIARRIRELKVFCKILPHNITSSELKKLNPKGIILSGGPASVYDKKSPGCDKKIFNLNIPVLGICYGMQLMAMLLKGKVTKTSKREYGNAELSVIHKSLLFVDMPKKFVCWMSHGDYISKLPLGFKKIAKTKNTPAAVIEHSKNKIYGVQFHPEVIHTYKGKQIIDNFITIACGCRHSWTMKSFVKQAIKTIKEKVEDNKVVLGLSGGVDSSVTAILLHKAIGRNLTCIFVDNALLRKNEAKKVKELFKKHYKLNLICVDAQERFLKKLKGVANPEKKRKIIGKEFIQVFEEEARKLGNVTFLAQGTLYPDVIESISAFGGPSATIKSHHNVGGLPEKMHLKLIEPLRELFKDEVRSVGRELGLPVDMINRHPFPGPGLAVRIIGSLTKERLDLLREVDAITIEEIKNARLYNKIWQAFAVLLPIKSVGVMGDKRTYENVVAIRAVTSHDGMTADWFKFPYSVLSKISNRIINEVKGVNRVTYDISSKPPATIEWE